MFCNLSHSKNFNLMLLNMSWKRKSTQSLVLAVYRLLRSDRHAMLGRYTLHIPEEKFFRKNGIFYAIRKTVCQNYCIRLRWDLSSRGTCFIHLSNQYKFGSKIFLKIDVCSKINVIFRTAKRISQFIFWQESWLCFVAYLYRFDF